MEDRGVEGGGFSRGGDIEGGVRSDGDGEVSGGSAEVGVEGVVMESGTLGGVCGADICGV